MMPYRRILAVVYTLFALATVVVVAKTAGNAAAGTATASATTSAAAEPTACVDCAECAVESPPAEPSPQPTPQVALRRLTTSALELEPSDSPSAQPPRWDGFNYKFRVDVDAKFKPTFNPAKSGAHPTNRTDAIDEITAGEDRRHDCFTITFDGPLDLECEETNRGVDFFGDEHRTSQKLSRLSVERVTRQDGETVLRFVYRYPRFKEKGFYDIGLNCKTPIAP
jgi:hypothetical protein